MNILIIHYNSFLIEDLQQCMEQMGHNYKLMEADVIVRESDDNFGSLFDKKMESEKYDCVFTFNYSSIISNCVENIIYLIFLLCMIAQCIACLQNLFIINVIIVLYLMDSYVNS